MGLIPMNTNQTLIELANVLDSQPVCIILDVSGRIWRTGTLHIDKGGIYEYPIYIKFREPFNAISETETLLVPDSILRKLSLDLTRHTFALDLSMYSPLLCNNHIWRIEGGA